MKHMKQLLGLAMALVLALSLVPAAGAASMEPVDSIAVKGLVKPWVDDTPSTDITVSAGVTVQDNTKLYVDGGILAYIGKQPQ